VIRENVKGSLGLLNHLGGRNWPKLALHLPKVERHSADPRFTDLQPIWMLGLRLLISLLPVVAATRRKYQTQPNAEANDHPNSGSAKKSPKRLTPPDERDNQWQHHH